MVPKLIESTMVSVVGPIASGKTFLVRLWVEGMPRVVVFDPTGELSDLPGEHFWGTPKAFADYLSKNQTAFRAVYHPTSNLEEGFDTVASAIWQLDAPRWLVIEEIHQLMSPFAYHEKMKMIMKYSRKRLLGVIGTTQRFADMHREFISASRLAVIFHPGNDAPSMERVEEMWGKETAAQLAQARPLIYDDVTEMVKQTPQALIVERGQQPRVEEIG